MQLNCLFILLPFWLFNIIYIWWHQSLKDTFPQSEGEGSWGLLGLGFVWVGGGIVCLWGFGGLSGRAAVGRKSRSKIPLMSSLLIFRVTLNSAYKTFYKIQESSADSLLYSLQRLNWYSTSAIANAKWIAHVTSFAYFTIIVRGTHNLGSGNIQQNDQLTGWTYSTTQKQRVRDISLKKIHLIKCSVPWICKSQQNQRLMKWLVKSHSSFF